MNHAVDQLDQLAVAQAGSARPRPRGTRSGPVGVRRPRVAGHGDDGRHHQVDRDDVDHALGHAGELPQQAPGVGDDDRLGHPEAADPARAGLGQGRLDDRGPDDGDRDGVPVLGDQGPLAQGLGEGVGVGPARGPGPGPGRLDHLLLDPVLAEALGPLGQQVEPGPAELLAGRLVEPVQALGPTGLGLAVAAQAAGRRRPRCRQSTSMVNAVGRRAAPPWPRPGGCRPRRPSTPGRGGAARCRPSASARSRAATMAAATRDGPEQVDLDGGVEGGVEADRGGRVDDDVAAASSASARRRRGPGRRCPTSPATAVTRRGHLVVEASPELGAQAVEAVVAEDLLGGPLRRRSARRPGRTSSTTSLSGTQRRIRSTRAVPRNPVAPVTKKRLPARASRTRVTRSVYHMVSDRVDHQRTQTSPEGRDRQPAATGAARPSAADRGRADAPPTGSSTPPWPPSAPGATRPPRSTPWPSASTSASRPSSTGSRRKEVLLEAVIDRSAVELSAALEASLATAGSGWARVEAVVRSVFRLAARRPELLGLVREMGRLGPAGRHPVRDRRRAAGAAGVRVPARPRWTPATCAGTSPGCCCSPSTPR